MGLLDKLFGTEENNNNIQQNEDELWFEKIYKWAKENNMDNGSYTYKTYCLDYDEAIIGIPNDKSYFLQSSNDSMPLVLQGKFDNLPDEICNLTTLKIDIRNCPNLILTEKQKEWIKNGNIWFDNDLQNKITVNENDSNHLYKKASEITHKQEKRLINMIQKLSNQEEVFKNIKSDLIGNMSKYYLSIYKDTDEYKVMQLADAKVNDVVVAGLLLQGLCNKSDYDDAYNNLNEIQDYTNLSEELMREATIQAVEFIQSYESKITEIVLRNIISITHNQLNEKKPVDPEHYLTFDELIDIMLDI